MNSVIRNSEKEIVQNEIVKNEIVKNEIVKNEQRKICINYIYL